MKGIPVLFLAAAVVATGGVGVLGGDLPVFLVGFFLDEVVFLGVREGMIYDEGGN